MPRNNFCEHCHREYLGKAWLRKNHNCGRSNFLKFLLPYGPMLTNMKKNVKIKKCEIFKNREKNGLEMWGIATFPQMLGGFWENALYRWTMDERATALALLTQSNTAKIVQKDRNQTTRIKILVYIMVIWSEVSLCTHSIQLKICILLLHWTSITGIYTGGH